MAELHALKKHWKSMIDAISEDDVSGINHCLYGKKVYGSKERDAIDSKQTASEKMSKVLKAAEKKIKGDPTAFEILLQALREESAYSYLANELERTRDEYYSSCSDESEEETDESSDDDVSHVQKISEQSKKRTRGPGKSGKKRVKKESRPVPPSVRTRKSGDERNGGSNRRKPKGSSSSKATAQASSKNGSESRNGSSGSSSALDTEPTEKDLRKLVAEKVYDSQALGTMLGVDYSRIEMFISEEKRIVSVNMRILTTWISSETRMPTTWRTLLQALREMGEKRLAKDITKELEQRGQ